MNLKTFATAAFACLIMLTGCGNSPVGSEETVFDSPAKNTVGVAPYYPRLAVDERVNDPIILNADYYYLNDWNGVTTNYVADYFVSIVQSDPWWGITGTESGGWLTSYAANSSLDGNCYPLNDFLYWKKFPLNPGNYYRIKIATTIGGWHESVRLIYVIPPKAIVNGSSNSPVIIPFNTPILVGDANNALDSSYSEWQSNHYTWRKYFVSVQLSDINWNCYGKEIMSWLGSSNDDFSRDMKIYTDNLDLRDFVARNYSVPRLSTPEFSLRGGNYYRVKVATNGMGPNAWGESVVLIYLKDRPPRRP